MLQLKMSGRFFARYLSRCAHVLLYTPNIIHACKGRSAETCAKNVATAHAHAQAETSLTRLAQALEICASSATAASGPAFLLTSGMALSLSL